MHATFVVVGGVRTRVIVAGQGEPVVLLHGIGMSADCFCRNVDALARDRQVFALDLLGHGFTDWPGFPAGGALHAISQHVLDFLSGHGIGPAHMIGSSLGGGIVADCALMAPERVRSCVIVGSSTPFATPQALGVGLSKARENATRSFETGDYEDLKRRLRYLVHMDAGICEELLAMQMTIYALEDRKAAYDALVDDVVAGAPGSWEVAGQVDGISVPTLVIAGRNDPRSPLDVIETGAGRMPAARLVVYNDCGHFPFLEYPDRFNAEVSAFLSEVEGF